MKNQKSLLYQLILLFVTASFVPLIIFVNSILELYLSVGSRETASIIQKIALILVVLIITVISIVVISKMFHLKHYLIQQYISFFCWFMIMLSIYFFILELMISTPSGWSGDGIIPTIILLTSYIVFGIIYIINLVILAIVIKRKYDHT